MKLKLLIYINLLLCCSYIYAQISPCNATYLNGTQASVPVNGTTAASAQSPNPTCGTFTSAAACNDNWFKIVVPPNGNVDAIITNSGGNSGITAYTSSTNDCSGTFTEVGCDVAANSHTLNLIGLTPTDTVYVRLWDDDCNGDRVFDSFSLIAFTSADEPCDAVNIAIDDIGIGTTAGNTETTNPGVPSHCLTSSTDNAGFNTANICEDTWFTVTIPASGSVEVTLDVTAGGDSDMAMAAYIGACGSLTQVVCDDDDGISNTPKLVLSDNPNTIYYIRVWDNGCDATAKEFEISVTETIEIRLNPNINSTINLTCGTTYNFHDSGGPGTWNGTAGTGSFNGYYVDTPNQMQEITFCAEAGQVVMVDFEATFPTCLTNCSDGIQGNETYSYFEQVNLNSPNINDSGDLETGNDYLYIYDGNDTASGNPLGTYTGTAAANPEPGTVYSTSECITFRMTTANSGTSWGGWNAYVSCAAAATVNATETICAATFAENALTNNQHEVWTYCPATAGDCIWADFSSSFSLETEEDYLYVYNGNSVDEPLLGIFTQSNNSLGILKATIENTSGCLTFRYMSDGGVAGTGWSAAISCGECRLPNGTDACGDATNITQTGTYAAMTVNFDGEGVTSGDNPTAEGGDPNLPTNDAANGDGATGENCFAGEQEITILENNHWYKFTMPSVDCAGGFDFGLNNISCQNTASFAGAQIAIYHSSAGCQNGTAWGNPLYCADILQNGSSINLNNYDGLGNSVFGVPSDDPTLKIIEGETYYIMFDGYVGGHCNYDLVVSGFPDNINEITASASSLCTGNTTDLTINASIGIEILVFETATAETDGDAVYALNSSSTDYIASYGPTVAPDVNGEIAYPSLSLPTNTTCTPRTFQIYARDPNNDGSTSCDPFASTTVIVYPLATATSQFDEPTASCATAIIDNCAAGEMTIMYDNDNDLAGNGYESAVAPTIFAGDPDVTVRYEVKATGSPSGCETTGSYVVSCASAPVSISGSVFLDENTQDGFNTGETPITTGVTVALYDYNSGSPILITQDLNGTPLMTTTDSNGDYSFANLPPATYYVVFSTPTGNAITTQPDTIAEGDDDDSDIDSNGQTPNITLASGENATDVDAGFILVCVSNAGQF